MIAIAPTLSNESGKELRLDHPEVTLRLLLSGAEQIAQRLRTLSATTGPTSLSTQFYTRVRAKSSASIREKVARKRRDPDPAIRDPNYSYRDLTDAVGFRIVTLYDKDLITALDYVIDLIRAGQRLPDPLFKRQFVWGLFDEALFIRRSEGENDPYGSCLSHLRTLVTDVGSTGRAEYDSTTRFVLANCREETRKGDRYSSAHIIFRACAYVGAVSLEIPVEFQLRTAVEDVWAEINHKFIYKVNTALVWSANYQLAYDETKNISVKLKDAIDRLPAVIDDFYRKSHAASGEISGFWNEPNPDFQFSLVISMFFSISERHGARYSVYLIKYRDLVDRLRDIHRSWPIDHAHQIEAKAEAREVIAASIAVLEKVKQDIAALQMHPNYALTASKVTRKIDCERINLCELEELRLKTLLIIHFDCWIADAPSARGASSDNDIRLTSVTSDGRQEVLLKLYSQFCEYLDHPVSLRPECMVLFFKHLIAIGLDSTFGKSLAGRNLLNSYELLDIDKTIPKWSIYRVLLPRSLATFNLFEAKSTLEIVASERNLLAGMGALRDKIQGDLADAMNYALRAAREHSEKESPKRGDIIFGFGPNEQIQDLTIVIEVCWVYMQYFDNIKKRLLSAVRSEVCATLRRFIHLTDNNMAEETISRLRGNAKEILRALDEQLASA